jgi:type IV pilus assembly protein PilC
MVGDMMQSAKEDVQKGIPLSQTFISNSNIYPVMVGDMMQSAKEDVQKGIPLSQTFISNSNIYPVMVGDMMEVGEETGRLSDMLLKIAVFYEEEVDAATSDMSKLIEPILMVMIASSVGIFAYAMITPMYSLMDSV